MTFTAFLGFCALCVVLTLTPGPDSLLILRAGLVSRRAGFAAALGSVVGSMLWAVLVAVGVASLLAQSAEAFRVVKIVGGLYLLFLGGRILLHRTGVSGSPRSRRRPSGFAPNALTGLLSTALNPKVGLFFLAVVPQFAPMGPHLFPATILLGATLAAISLAYLTALTLVAHKAAKVLTRPRVSRAIEISSGGIFAGLGIGTIASSAAT